MGGVGGGGGGSGAAATSGERQVGAHAQLEISLIGKIFYSGYNIFIFMLILTRVNLKQKRLFLYTNINIFLFLFFRSKQERRWLKNNDNRMTFDENYDW